MKMWIKSSRCRKCIGQYQFSFVNFQHISSPKATQNVQSMFPVEMYVSNPSRCFICQKFGHHESNCPVDQGSLCKRCCIGNNDHQSIMCKNPVECVNCIGIHMSRLSDRGVWRNEEENEGLSYKQIDIP